MKAEVLRILKEKNESDSFTQQRFEFTKASMKYCMSKDPWLKNCLSLDPLNRVQWVADHLIKLKNLSNNK